MQYSVCMGKYIGIDYGEKKTGIAISDTLGTVAFPRMVIATQKLNQYLQELFTEEDIVGIVIGESKDFAGTHNAIHNMVKTFVQTLTRSEALDIPIYYEDERLSTHQATMKPQEGSVRGTIANTRRKACMRGKRQVDAHAAAVILQSFLDKQKNIR